MRSKLEILAFDVFAFPFALARLGIGRANWSDHRRAETKNNRSLTNRPVGQVTIARYNGRAREQIIGRERRERLSQLTRCGGGCFESRRRTLIKGQLKTVVAKA